MNTSEDIAMAHDEDAFEDALKDLVHELAKDAKPLRRSTSYLEPEDSPFSRRPGMRLYEQMLAESLLGEAERVVRSLTPAWMQEEKAILVCLPSFEPEWALVGGW